MRSTSSHRSARISPLRSPAPIANQKAAARRCFEAASRKRVISSTVSGLISLLRAVSVPYTERIPARMRDRLFRGLDSKIDAIQELTNQIAIQEQRICRSLEIEESLKVGLPETNRQIELRHRMLMDLVRILQETGRLPCRQNPLVSINNNMGGSCEIVSKLVADPNVAQVIAEVFRSKHGQTKAQAP